MPETREQRAERNHSYYVRDVEERRTIIREAKDVPCLDCGGRFHFSAMDFDHVRGDKVADISAMVVRRYPVPVIMDEIGKCDVVCANCHRLRTYERGY